MDEAVGGWMKRWVDQCVSQWACWMSVSVWMTKRLRSRMYLQMSFELFGVLVEEQPRNLKCHKYLKI